MTAAERDRRRVSIPVAIASLSAWIIIGTRSGRSVLVGSCCIPATLQEGLTASSWQMLLERNPVSQIALNWGLMVVAMMGPLMCPCIQHIRESTFAKRRFRSISLFAVGYLAVWMAAAFLLLPIVLAERLFVPTSIVPLCLGVVIAMLWQLSPVKQRCLNRKHAHPALEVFGFRANLDALRFGLSHGVWCFTSCWALMLLAELLPVGQIPAMALFTIWLIAENLDRPAEPRWRLRGVGKAYRLVKAQTSLFFGARI